MVDQKVSNANGTEGFFITFYCIGFVFFSYVLVKQSLEHSSILEFSSIFIWIIVCIVQVCFQSYKLRNSKSANAIDIRDEDQISPTVIRLIGGIAASVVCILLWVLFRGDVDIFKPQTQLVGQPGFEPFSYGSNIAIGMMFIIGDLIKLFDIKNSLLRSILSLLKNMLLISGIVMLLICTTHLTEVSL